MALVVETPQLKEVYERAAQETDLSAVHSVWCFDEGALDHLRERGKDVPDEEIERRRDLAGLDDLAKRVDADGWAVAFSLYPTAMADLMAVADAGLVMPPKSTWFEPKLADGLLSLPITG